MSNKWVWLTDLHLDMVSPIYIYKLIRHVNNKKPNYLFITGDISSGPFLKFHLKLLASTIKCPIYFVLGNHDYYGSSFEKQHSIVREICQKYDNLRWLTESNFYKLQGCEAVIGTEGWYDARLGCPHLLVGTIDWILIKELRDCYGIDERIEKFKKLSAVSSDVLLRKVKYAIDSGIKKIYVLTHFPPWKEVTNDENRLLKDFWLPYNTNSYLGLQLKSIMDKNPDCHMTVLCGHIHKNSYVRISDNIECISKTPKY